MEPISAVTALAPLVIEWFKERRSQDQDASEQSFRQWFQDVAYAQLLEATTLAFRTVSIGQKAHHGELLSFLSKQFADVQSTLQEIVDGKPHSATIQERWQVLGPEAHSLLGQLVALVIGDTYENSLLSTPFAVAEASDEGIDLGRKRMVEGGLARYIQHTGGAALRLTALGYLVTEAVRAPETFQSHLLRIQGGLRRFGFAPVDKLVAACMGRCSPALLYCVIERWDEVGWVSLQKLDQRSRSRVSHAAQQMLDANADELARVTLRTFVEG